MRMRGPDTDGRDGTRAHFARRRSGQLRRMVDGSRPGRGYGGVLGRYHRNHLRHRKDKNCPKQRRGMVMRSAAVVVTRPTVSMIAVGLGMSHAVRMRGNLPVLESMGGVGHDQKRQTSQPNNAKSAPGSHAGATLSSGIARSNPFHAPRQTDAVRWLGGMGRVPYERVGRRPRRRCHQTFLSSPLPPVNLIVCSEA